MNILIGPPPHINHFCLKLVKANAMLCKLPHFVNVATMSESESEHRVTLLQKKAMRIISFVSFDVHTLPIFAKLNIIKLPDLISICNCLFIYEHFLNKSSSVFSNVFILTSNIHE